MRAPRAFAALAVAGGLGLGLLSGCGGGSEGTSTVQASAAVRARADANCRQLRRDVVELGRGAFEGADNLAEATTEHIVRPSIPLLENFALRQQRLAKGSGDPQLQLYARLFEPVIVLAHERLRLGEESNAPFNPAAKGIEILTSTVAEEQRQLAREAGVEDCAIDFEQVLTTAIRG